jgi:outer membrane protein assembly factor BamB
MRSWGTGIVVALIALSTSGCWLQTGAGPGHQSFVSEVTLTSSNEATLHQVWSKNVGAFPLSAPIVNGGRLFVSGSTFVTALNAATGVQAWQTDTTFATYSPSLGELAVYQNRVQVPYSIYSFGGSYSFDPATGTYTDSGTQQTFPYNAPVVAGGTLVTDIGAANQGGALSAVQYGNQVGFINFWSNIGAARPATVPMVRGNQVFVGSETSVLAFPTDSCTPAAIPTDCAPSWTTDVGSTAGMPASLSPTQLAVPLANGDVAVLDAATGAVQWTAHTGSTAAQSPAIDAANIYVGTSDGKVRTFPVAGCGSATCSATTTSTAAGAAITSQPVVAGGVVYVGTGNGKVVAFDTSGNQLAALTVNAGASRVSVIEDGATVYATTDNGTAAAFRAA